MRWYVRSWHETDIPTALRDVRSQGQSGKHMLALSFSDFDPTATSAVSFECASLNRYDAMGSG
jgi:hypothetical protein